MTATEQQATVAATPYCLIEDVYQMLRAQRQGRTTGQTDNQDLTEARILARGLWAKGWRRREL